MPHEDEVLSNALRRADSIGRPLGDAAFLDRLEHLTGRSLGPQNATLNHKITNNCTVIVIPAVQIPASTTHFSA